MEWANIKDKVYYTDNGYFRRIISYNLTLEDWENWINFVNTNYKVVFKSYQSQETTDKISLSDIKSYWEGKEQDGFMASIYLENVQINCFFNGSDDLDNDIDATEVNKIEQHYIILEYMKDISKCLNKKIFLEKDYYEEDLKILIEVDKHGIIYPVF